MEFNGQPIDFNFSHYIAAPMSLLIQELVETHEQIANLAVRIAFLRAEEDRKVDGAKPLRLEMEGTLAAYTERKWLLKTLMDIHEHVH